MRITSAFLFANCASHALLVARGGHGEAIRRRGLTLRTPEQSASAALPCVARVADVRMEVDVVVILAVKSHDAGAALAGVDPGAAIVCAQNGVVTEPHAAARFERLYGMMSWIPAVHLQPGLVEVYASAPPGLFRVGGYPGGVDTTAEALAADLVAAGFDAEPVADVMRWKHGKLLANLGNVLDAFCVADPGLG